MVVAGGAGVLHALGCPAGWRMTFQASSTTRASGEVATHGTHRASPTSWATALTSR